MLLTIYVLFIINQPHYFSWITKSLSCFTYFLKTENPTTAGEGLPT